MRLISRYCVWVLMLWVVLLMVGLVRMIFLMRDGCWVVSLVVI